MQSSKEQQGEIRKPSSVINAKKQRKTIEWERLEISSRKLELPREHFYAKMGLIKDRNGMDLTEAEEELPPSATRESHVQQQTCTTAKRIN